MSPTEIKVILLRRGLTQRDLARQFGCRREELSMCIGQKPGRSYPRLREKLARELGMTVEQLFGKAIPKTNARRKAA